MKKAPIVLVTLVVVLIWLFWFQAVMLFQAKKMAGENPAVKQIPRALDVTVVSATPGSKLTYAGYDFEVPWTDSENEPRVLHNGAAIRFKSGISLLFLASQPNELVSALCEKEDKAKQSGAVRQVYGDDAVKSDYDLKRVELEATPDKVTLFSSRRDLVRNSTLLMLKSLTLPKEAESGIFNISNGRFKGFQIGSPEKQARKIVVDLYSDQGSVEMIFAQKEGNLSLSQADINRIVQTIRITDPPVQPATKPNACL